MKLAGPSTEDSSAEQCAADKGVKGCSWEVGLLVKNKIGTYSSPMTKTQVGHFELIREELGSHNRQLSSSQEKSDFVIE